ncbi:MAG: PLDc N-terminal domain-containing protein [Actinomycetota bacterium]
MIAFEGFAAIALMVLWIFAIVDVISTDTAMVRNLPKPLWLLLVIILPDVGSIAWLILGRPKNARFLPGSTEVRRSSGAIAPPPAPRGGGRPMNEDSPDFMRQVEMRKLKAWEEDLHRREEELKRKGDQDPGASPP